MILFDFSFLIYLALKTEYFLPKCMKIKAVSSV